jgi:polysaccharide export outer membrane protein
VKTKLPILLITILAIALVSCNRRSQLLYIQNLDPADEALMAKPPVYRLQPGDILYIQLITPSPEISQAFNNPTGTQVLTRTQDESSLYLNGYAVNDSGMVALPFLGEAKVQGLTVNEAKDELQKLTEKMYKDATLNVKLASFKITVLGEVRRPGNVRNYNDQFNVFEAIAAVGDISENGDRKKVLVVRPSNEGNKTFRLDLTDKSVLASEAFYLLPNDIIIVEPLGNKVFQMNVPYVTLTFSTLSTLILLYNFITRL